MPDELQEALTKWADGQESQYRTAVASGPLARYDLIF